MILTNKALKKHILDTVRATEPVVPRCQHAVECGGCAFQDRAYADQVKVKTESLQQIWAEALPGVAGDISVVASPDPYNYRTRMDYVASKGRFGLRRSGKFNYIIDLVECHLIPPTAFAVALKLYERAVELGLPDYNLRSHEGFLRYFVVRRSPQDSLMLALVTASREHEDAMAQLAELALSFERVTSFHWLLNESLTDLSFGESIRHWGARTLPMKVGEKLLQIGPNTFFQNNVHLLLPLLDDVAACVGPAARVADLYGGVGTIALHLANQVTHITCVEEVAESVALATINIAQNAASNVRAIAADTFRFLRDQQEGAFDVVVVDPPRTGLGPEVSRELVRLAPRRIVYVSCNPLTQVEDARLLLEQYTLNDLRGYDMFPHTPHLESLAVFDRRDNR
jgi:23S rRNA (uracil-5-)-methyltransferase RumA